MKNKFEALTTFQQWPEDWQFLCAEYWASSVMRNGAKPAPLEAQATAFDKSSIMPATTKTLKKIIPWTVMEEEYLSKCWEDSGRHRTSAARLFLEKHPGRSLNAVCRHIWDMKCADGHLVIRY